MKNIKNHNLKVPKNIIFFTKNKIKKKKKKKNRKKKKKKIKPQEKIKKKKKKKKNRKTKMKNIKNHNLKVPSCLFCVVGLKIIYSN